MKNCPLSILGLFIIVYLSSCTEPDLVEHSPVDPCEEIRLSKYKDLITSTFTVNGSEILYQNYTPYTYRNNQSEMPRQAKLWQIRSASNRIELHFTRIHLDTECTASKLHGFTILCNLDQSTSESKTYKVGSTFSSSAEASAYYAFGELLSEGESIRNSANDAGLLTITKWDIESRISGNFEIDIDGILVTGEFDYDLTNDYLSF